MNVRHDGLEVALDIRADLGEGPWWDIATHSLLWLDLFEGRIHSFDPASGQNTSISVGQPIGCFALRTDGGILAAVRDGLGFADRGIDGLELVSPVEIDNTANRANDGACDAAGRFWNGIDWSPDNRRMYHADTGTGAITAYHFDLAAGTLSDPVVVFTAPGGTGSPDGLCVDSAGDLWVAMWDGFCVLRLSAEGELKQRIPLPVARVTSVAFGGDELEDLFITTARRGRSSEQLADEPHAGSIFHLRPGVAGLAPHRFGG
jgi:sugar lactone lactonase YvrE